VSPSTRVASASTSQVDALGAGTNIAFDTAASGSQNRGNDQPQSHLNNGGGSRQQYVEQNVNRLFTADSQSFAAIFQGPATAKPSRVPSGGAARSTNAPVSRIIRTYETNAQVISGTQPVRGTAFSFNL